MLENADAMVDYNAPWQPGPGPGKFVFFQVFLTGGACLPK